MKNFAEKIACLSLFGDRKGGERGDPPTESGRSLFTDSTAFMRIPWVRDREETVKYRDKRYVDQ